MPRIGLSWDTWLAEATPEQNSQNQKICLFIHSFIHSLCDTIAGSRSIWHHPCTIILSCYEQPLLRKDGAPAVADQKAWRPVHNPLRMTEAYPSLSPPMLPAALAVARSPPSLCEKGCLWLIDVCRCGCWHPYSSSATLWPLVYLDCPRWERLHNFYSLLSRWRTCKARRSNWCQAASHVSTEKKCWVTRNPPNGCS